MPLLSRLSVTSARGFGELAGRRSVTVIFTANGTWTAPAGVVNVAALEGKGEDGISDSTSANQPVSWVLVNNINATFSTGIDPRTYSYDAVYSSFISAALSAVNTGSGVITVTRTSWYSSIFNTGNFGGAGDIQSPNVNFFLSGDADYVAGTGSVQSPGGTFLVSSPWPSGTQMGYQSGPGTQGDMVVATQYNYGGVGASSSALGYTFSGGGYSAPDGFPATPVTVNNVAVTPGPNYSIVVAPGGYVYITYFA